MKENQSKSSDSKTYKEGSSSIRLIPYILIFMILIAIGIGVYISLDIYSTWKTDQAIKEYLSERIDLTKDGLIPFVAKVKKTEIAPQVDSRGNISGYNDTFYIVDYDGHIFSTYFEPDLLFLEDGSYIKVYYDTKYYDDNYIPIKRWNIYGALENEYYMNKK